MRFDRQQSAAHVVAHLARLFTQALQRRMGRHGVTAGQFPVLLLLWEKEEVTQTQLAAELGVEQPTMANTLKRMERDGLIERVPDPNDRRQARIRPTPRGRELEEALVGSAREANTAALAGLTSDKRELFLVLARKLVSNLERDARDAP